MKKMKKPKNSNQSGFSLIEMTIAMGVTLVLLGLTATLFASALSTRARESRRADALTAARAAISVMSREIANSGYGIAIEDGGYIPVNGIVLADSNKNRLHFRANTENRNGCTRDRGEDVTYFFDDATKSIVRHERFSSDANNPCGAAAQAAETSVVVNRISNVTFKYYNYSGGDSTPLQLTGTDNPTTDTGRVTISVEVELEEVPGQPKNQKITFTSDITLRNSKYMLKQY